MRARFAAAGLGTAALLAAVAPASAQIIETRPVPALFRITSDPTLSHTAIDLTTFFSGGYESTTAARSTGRLSVPFTDDNAFGNLVLHVRFMHTGTKRSFGADGGTTTSYYSSTGGMSPLSSSASVHFEGVSGRRSMFSLRQAFYYSPYYVLAPFETTQPQVGEAPVQDPTATGVDPRVDLRSARLATKGYDTFAGMRTQVSQRGSVSGFYQMHYVDLAQSPDLFAQTPGFGYRLRLGRYAAFTASYALQTYTYRNSGYSPLVTNNVGVGIAYEQPLTLRHHTSYGFTTGTAAAKQRGLMQFHFVGSAHVSRQIARSWIASLRYLRNQQVLEGFTAPFLVFGDTVAGSIGGRAGRDVRLFATLAYTHGSYSLASFDNVFHTVSGTGRVQIPIMWLLALNLEGYYSDYGFQQRLGLLEGIPGTVHRFGTRAGLTLNVPVLR